MAATQSTEDDMITGINVTPLVDIILVLLIIFMLTANIISKPSIAVELPQASTGEASEPTTVALTLTKDGELYLNGAPTDEAALKAYLPGVVKSDPRTQAVIAADKEVTHGRVIHVIDLVRTAGIFKFALNIDPAAAEAVSGK
jgi:biopolymer transport protein ExbD